jgi:hypothetical protein
MRISFRPFDAQKSRFHTSMHFRYIIIIFIIAGPSTTPPPPPPQPTGGPRAPHNRTRRVVRAAARKTDRRRSRSRAPPSSSGLSAVGVAAAAAAATVATGAVCVVGSRAPVVVLRARQPIRVFCVLFFCCRFLVPVRAAALSNVSRFIAFSVLGRRTEPVRSPISP